MNRPRLGEWPLVLFTVGLQLAAGIAIMAAIESGYVSGTQESVRKLSIAVSPIVLVAILGSLLHVGRPFQSWRALSNLGSSRLTAELVVCLVFACAALVESFLCWNKGHSPRMLNAATAIVALAAVVSSSRIYSIPAQPLWNSAWTHVSFCGATLLLGGVAAFAVDKNAGKTMPSVLPLFTWIGAVLVVVSMLAAVRSILRLGNLRYAPPEAISILQPKHWVAVSTVVLIGILVPLCCTLSSIRESGIGVVVLLLSFVAVSTSRALMFSRGLELSRF